MPSCRLASACLLTTVAACAVDPEPEPDPTLTATLRPADEECTPFSIDGAAVDPLCRW